jgi:very-short-patch-repair endonuclease
MVYNVAMLQVEALEILKTGSNVFLTGVPGAGKSYVINQYVKYLEDKGIYPAITASTGIAATHIGGQTIHSFSGIGIEKDIDEYKLDRIMEREKLVKKIQNTKVLIIDEISMLDAQTLDNVNKVLKGIKDPTKAFGGLQIVFVGDFFQLPPVTKRGEETKYFAFMSRAWKEAKPLVCYLEEQYRQSDETFTKLLLAIRENNIDEYHVEILEDLKNKTYKKFGWKLPKQENDEQWEEDEIQLEPPIPAFPPEGKGHKILPYNPNLVSAARENRKNLTEAESKFWELVKNGGIGFEFVRQKPVKSFILDFYSKELNLGIEIDGGYHLDVKEKARDKERENILKEMGIRVLRFTNYEILNISEDDLIFKIEDFVNNEPLPSGEGFGVGVEATESKNQIEVADVDVLELHSHNKNVDEINMNKLAKLPGKEFTFKMIVQGRKNLVENLIKSCLSPEILKLKQDAKVIFTKNALDGEYVNGTMGIVKDVDREGIVVETKSGKLINVKPEEWKIEDDGKVLARISQYPLRLAWAITVHKSQGMSLDEAIISLGETFEFGQGYVALSRLKALDGLYLKSYNPKSLQINSAISEFDEKIRKDSRFIQNKFQKADRKNLDNLQRTFVEKSGGVWEGGIVKKEKEIKKPTTEITLDMIKEGKNMEEIMKEREMKVESIMKHIEELYKKGKVTKADLEKLPPSGVNIFSVPNEVSKSFKKHQFQKDEEGNIKLSPVFKDLKEKYDFAQLRWYRLML